MDNESSYITFIIPTIGRETLLKTIDSLIQQTVKSWRCIIVFDGIKISDYPKLFEFIQKIDNIVILECDKKGAPPNSAGKVRNEAFALMSSDKNSTINSNTNSNNNMSSTLPPNLLSKWIGFVDDDDVLHPKYIEYLQEEEKTNPNVECVIFRMMDRNNNVVPTMKDKNIIAGHVGISFVIKKELSEKHKFENSSHEDFCFLKTLQMAKIPIIISPYISYFVQREVDLNIAKQYFNRVCFNF